MLATTAVLQATRTSLASHSDWWPGGWVGDVEEACRPTCMKGSCRCSVVRWQNSFHSAMGLQLTADLGLDLGTCRPHQRGAAWVRLCVWPWEACC